MAFYGFSGRRVLALGKFPEILRHSVQASAITRGGEEVHLWGGGGGGGGGGGEGGDPGLGPTRGAQHACHQVPSINPPGASLHPGKEKPKKSRFVNKRH